MTNPLSWAFDDWARMIGQSIPKAEITITPVIKLKCRAACLQSEFIGFLASWTAGARDHHYLHDRLILETIHIPSSKRESMRDQDISFV
ncbi:MAG: hypothetical protein WCA10_07390 [Terracidiphilus sp.]